jgi:hypothetical protein
MVINLGEIMKKAFIGLVVFLFTLPLYAAVSLPANFYELEGAYKGVGVTSKTVAHLLVYKIQEEGEASGRFFIFLLTGNKTRGQIFDGEWIGGESIGLIANGKSADGRYLDPKLPPAGTLEKGLDQKHGQVLKLNKLDNSNLLTESYYFHRDSDDVKINNVKPLGLFTDRKNTVTSTHGLDDTMNVDTLVPALNHQGKFVGVFELDGVVVLRKQVLDNNLLSFNELEISGVMVSIIDGRRQSLILGNITQDGRPTPVKILNRKK